MPDPKNVSSAAFDAEAFLARFDWHPEPELIGIRDEAASREALRRFGDDAWSAALDYLYQHALRRAMGELTGAAALRTAFFGDAGGPGAAPAGPTRSAELVEEFRTRIAPHMLNAWHPGQLSYFTPPPLVASIVGELLAQVSHQGIDVWDAGPVGAFVEEEVVRWLCDLVGYGPGSFGILTSGGVMANFIGMALARDHHLARRRGLIDPPRGAALDGVRVYTSDQTHFSIGRALDELGFPRETLVVLPTDDAFRLPVDAVAAAVARDRAAGRLPLAIAAVAGSTNTGSVDPIDGLADVSAAEDLWLHVDAAYGGAARFSPTAAAIVGPLGRADSVTIDPHKWFFQAYDVGGIVVRDGSLLARTFGGRRPEYYRDGEGAVDRAGHDAEGLNFYQLGFEGTRRWRALKLWLSWKHVGSTGFGRLVDANIAVARHLAHRIAESDDFEAVIPEPELSVVCFRHLPPVLMGSDLDDHQDRLKVRLEASGEGYLSTTRLRGATWLRAGVLNYLTTEVDVDRLLDVLRELAR
jgi:glutamate/tyrosine decarboxylase-like PLP-dependent enzyme